MKRVISALLVLLLIFSFCIPQSVHASRKVTIRYKGGIQTYSKRMDYIFINGVKTDLRATPVFMKAGTNVGPLARIFVNSSLHVQYRLNGNKITLFYNNNSLTIKDGSQAIISNGKKVFNALAVAPMKTALYEEAKFPRWVVPIKSVCNRLGLNYDVSSDGYIHISEPAGVKNNANQIPNNGSGKGCRSPRCRPRRSRLRSHGKWTPREEP